jgi:predicted hydrocarbon binding protein
MNSAIKNRRVFIMAARAWEIVEDTLSLRLLKGANELLLEMGFAYGKSMALDYGFLTSEPENMGSFFESLGSLAGWGRISVEGNVASGSRITLKVVNCLFCRRGTSTTKERDSCYFLIGVSKGVVTTIYNRSYIASEQRCRLRGYDDCKIELRSRPT